LHLIRRPEFGTLIAAVVVYLIFIALTVGKSFVSNVGTSGWLQSAAELGVVAVPIGLLLIAGEFDLSIGSTVGMSAMTVALGTGVEHLPLWVSVVMALAFSVVIGVVNALLVVRFKFISLIATLTTALVVEGATYAILRIITDQATVSVTGYGVVQQIFAGKVGLYDVSIFWWLGATAIAAWILTRTALGNWILATGGDETAALEAGVPTKRVKAGLFVATSVGAGVLGIIQCLEYSTAVPGQGTNFIFDTIVAAGIGGILFGGGYGSAVGISLGCVVYSIVNVGVYYTGIDPNWANLILGLILFVAVVTNTYFRRIAGVKS
jgi:simple sugar transport system permease protein